MENNELYHHGILGQKWGVRRFQNKDGSLTTAGRKRNASAGETKGTSKNTKSKSSTSSDELKKMSDDQLRRAINRMQMEKQYKQLTSKDTSAGAKFVKEVVYNASKQTATNYVSKYMTKGLDELIKKVPTK